MTPTFNFDARTVKPQTEFTPLIPGMYKVVIEASEIKPTRANNGGFVEIKLKVIEGELTGRMIYERLNIWNDNEMAVNIAKATLSSICHVTGVYVLNSIADFKNLHNIPMFINVDYSYPKDSKEPNGNRIKGYKDINGNDPGKSSPGPSQPAQQAAQQPAQQAWGQSAPQQPAQQPAQQPSQQPSPAGNPPWGQPVPTASANTPPWATR
jgi:hypothetical protein